MRIISALFVENFALRQVVGPSTRIDITGAYFSLAAPGPFPVSIDPHLVVIIYCPTTDNGNSVLEVVFRSGSSENDTQLSRNITPFTVEPGRFSYRLIRTELSIIQESQVFAHCRLGTGHWHVVPLTILPPVNEQPNQG